MKLIKKYFNKKITFTITSLVFVAIFLFGFDYAQAAWETPSALPPDSNIFVPLNVGPERQAKEGNLLLNSLYNPYGIVPTVDYPLEVAGPNNVYIYDFEIMSEGDLVVDLDTLYVDGINNQVGIGILDPVEGAKLEVSGGGVYIQNNGANNIGLSVRSSSTKEVTYGISSSINKASIYGQSINGVGVYGQNISSGYGIYAMSGERSAVVGTTSKEYSTPGDVVSGIYASANGLGSWAGYFEQRLFGSSDIVGRKFSQSEPNYSQIPYTTGWEIKEISDSYDTAPNHITFDGEYFWVTQLGYNRVEIYLIDPQTGRIAKEFVPLDSYDNIYHNASKIIYESNYIWISGSTNFVAAAEDGCHTRETITRIDPNTFEVIHFPVGNCHDIPTDGTGLVVDMVYDDQTLGGPYIWTVNQITEGTYPNYNYSHSIGRLTVSDGSYYASCSDPLYNNRADCETNSETWNDIGDNPITISGQCLSLDIKNCSDGIDNDGDGNFDLGCQAADPINGYVDGFEYNINSSSKCAAVGGTWGTADVQCSNMDSESPDGNTPANDERLEVIEIGSPTSIVFDPTREEIWVSFNGHNAYSSAIINGAGEGLGKIDAVNPDAVASLYCLEDSLGNPRPGRRISDLAYDSINDRIWASQNPSWVTYLGISGISKINPLTGQMESEYNDDNPLYTFPKYINEIQIDELSVGGPYAFFGRSENLFKFDIANEIVVNNYVVPDGFSDFMISRIDPANPYVWGAHYRASLLTKNEVNAPYDVDTFVLKGTDSSDIVFDGTNIWTTNETGSSISKYRISDGEKIGDYQTGYRPKNVVFDGTYIWVDSDEDPLDKHLTQIRASDGELIGDYDKGDNFVSSDTIFDGRYLWFVGRSNDDFHKVDTLGCVDLDGSGSLVGSCPNISYAGILNGPSGILFDGEFLWTFNEDNSFTKISISDNDTPNNIADDTVTIVDTYTIAEPLNASSRNINVMKYDGTYIWFGTDYVGPDGSSVYKFDPNKCDVVASECYAADKYQIYHEPGRCSTGSTNEDRICLADDECGGGGTCEGNYSEVTGMVFDGINMWVINGTDGLSTRRECSDGIDNDNIGHCVDAPNNICSDDGDCTTGTCDLIDEDDYYGGWCENADDWREGSRCNDQQDNDRDGKIDMEDQDCIDAGDPNSDAEGNPECSDKLDNDGNGLCDYDGAAGHPGCSGKPDPGCKDDDDISEHVNTDEAHLSKIIASTGEVIESVSAGFYCDVVEMVFDGNSLWFGSNCDSTVLNQYYVGGNLGETDFSTTVSLQGSLPGTAQSGSFAVSGSANFGEKLIVVNDLVIKGNRWGGSADNEMDFGTGCSEGEFAKGIGVVAGTTYQLLCRPL